MQLADSIIVDIVRGVWEKALGMKVQQGAPSPILDPSLTGVVQISGTWQGAITLKCSSQLAAQIGAAMFGAAPDALSDDETRDALGEVVNMLAGNLKLHLPAGCHLSLPAVVEGRDYRVAIPGAGLLTRVCLSTCSDRFCVAILERAAE